MEEEKNVKDSYFKNVVCNCPESNSFSKNLLIAMVRDHYRYSKIAILLNPPCFSLYIAFQKVKILHTKIIYVAIC